MAGVPGSGGSSPWDERDEMEGGAGGWEELIDAALCDRGRGFLRMGEAEVGVGTEGAKVGGMAVVVAEEDDRGGLGQLGG